MVRGGEIPSPRQTSIDETNDCAMNSERSALVGGRATLGSPSSHNGRCHVAGAGQANDEKNKKARW